MAELMAASRQWAERPADERFWTLEAMATKCNAVRKGCAVASVEVPSLRAVVAGDDVAIVGKTERPAHLTHHTFGQLAGIAGAPGSYLRTLPSDLAAACINRGLAVHGGGVAARNILFHANGKLTARAILSEQYDRVWDGEVCAALTRLEGWRAPAGRTPPGYRGESKIATADDILPGQINITPGCPIAPSGLYASDHDMFAFLVAPDRVISDGAGGALMRGVFVRNSEVGDAALSFTFFLMQAVCGNHIVWNATGVHEIRVRHVGSDTFGRAMRQFSAELRRYHDAAGEEERGIIAARKLVLGASKDEVLDALVKYAKTHSLHTLSRKRLDDAYETARRHEDWYGNPRSLWGMVAGVTHASQATAYTDDRAAIDRDAGKLMSMAF